MSYCVPAENLLAKSKRVRVKIKITDRSAYPPEVVAACDHARGKIIALSPAGYPKMYLVALDDATTRIKRFFFHKSDLKAVK